ncbi:citramalate synthase [Gloeobacter kilaueensis]|uniref:Citramalate synthase n=1 Tax=Gloeobacter kilaueensis (strain ATCC BAA-2537 / CCAP 1431/1 / ULC 316 / JS1) TaxID=1183438 RepID=U5QJG6_GLOK1|nr:citramalate synthase [Gloeobacter kilaueensis]AGY57795.1 alpha-isopropylmalate/homocitrate synthase family transferase [Gloeobacter kilaueensis JS1]
MERIYLYDTTLRDGAQREGISFSVEDKLRVAHKLDDLGVAFIEGGWPGANPKDDLFFERLRGESFKHSAVAAFCSTRRPGLRAEADEGLKKVLAAGTEWVTTFGKCWDLHVHAGLRTSLEENLAMIEETVAFLRFSGRRVIFDCEHWFDGFAKNPDYALASLQAAARAGAEWLVLCDTNGGMLPKQIRESVGAVRAFCEAQDLAAGLGIHTHNDSETAVANALAAVELGARMVHGTINGYGERCGNANLCALLPNLQLKMGYELVSPDQLGCLTEVAHFVSEVANLAPNDHAAYVGASAFAHKGGIHVSAVQRNPQTYEHIVPESVGNRRRILVSDQAGLSNILHKLADLGFRFERHDPAVAHILQQIKQLEAEGYQFEAAEASFELLVRECLKVREPFFTLEGLYTACQTFPDQSVRSEATVRVRVGRALQHTAADGNGPVSALDAALRKALVGFYPQVASMHLVDYKVRILEGNLGTSALTRVLVESSDGTGRWTTIGVSPNIIEASCRAVIEGLEYGLSRGRR